MTTGNVTHWMEDDKKIAADASNDKSFSRSDADEVWGKVDDPNELYNPCAHTQEKVWEMEEQRREGINKYDKHWRQKAVATYMELANNVRGEDGKSSRCGKREKRKMFCIDSPIDISLPPSKNLSEEDVKTSASPLILILRGLRDKCIQKMEH